MFLTFLCAEMSVQNDHDETDQHQRLIERKIEDNLAKKHKGKSLEQHHEDIAMENVWQKIEGFLSFVVKKGVQVAYKLYPKAKNIVHTSDPKSSVIKISHGGYTQKDINCPPTQLVLNEDEAKETKKARLVAFNKDCGAVDVFCNTKSLPAEPPQQL